jgi:hypothetical protein
MRNRRSWMAAAAWTCPVAPGALIVACGGLLRANPVRDFPLADVGRKNNLAARLVA